MTGTTAKIGGIGSAMVLVDSAVLLIIDDGDLLLLPFNADSFSWLVRG